MRSPEASGVAAGAASGDAEARGLTAKTVGKSKSAMSPGNGDKAAARELRERHPLALPRGPDGAIAGVAPVYVATPYPLIRTSFLTRETARSHALLTLLRFGWDAMQTAHVLLSESDKVFPFQMRIYKGTAPGASLFVAARAEEIGAIHEFLGDLQREAEECYEIVRACFQSPDPVERAAYALVTAYWTDDERESHLTLDFLKRKYEHLNDLVKAVGRALYHGMGLA
jgi:hypothetical protein